MNLSKILTGIAVVLAVSASFVAVGPSKAWADCNMLGCTLTSVRVKTLSADTCSPHQELSGCGCKATYGGNCAGTASQCYNAGGTNNGACNNGTVCCSGIQLEEPAVSDEVNEDVSAALQGSDVQPMTSSYWGYYNSTLKTQSAGVSSNCEAKIHVCFVHGFSDLTGVTDQNSCNNACNSATNTNQDECYDTDCSSRCSGWWTGSGTCG